MHGYTTIVMRASFRNKGEIMKLAGCDDRIIAFNLLEELYNPTEEFPLKLDAKDAATLDIPKKSYINDESLFRFDFNEEQMTVTNLREGIFNFAANDITLFERRFKPNRI
jgi:transaldolase